MTGAASSAFQAATGHSPADVRGYLTGLLVALLFLWGAWVFRVILRSLMAGNEEAKVAWSWIGIRISALIAVVVFLVL